MKFLILGMIALSFSVIARTPEEKKALIESQNSCANFVRFDEQNLYLGFGVYQRWGEYPRSPIPSHMTIVSFDSREKRTIQTLDSAIDMVSDGTTVFILTFSGIEEWDLTTMTKIADHPTHNFSPNTYKSHAESWARYQDEMVIAHGGQGVSFFDLKSKKITGTLELLTAQAPLESQATGMTVIGKRAYVAMDSLSLVSEPPFPFKGIVVIDLETRKVIQELEGLDPGVDAAASFGNKLIVSYYGMPVWKYDVTDFKSRNKLPSPEIRVFRFPAKGRPMGAASMDEKYYYTCFMFHETEDSPRINRPMAINRKALLLD